MGHQLIVLVIFGIIAFFNWAVRQGTAKGGTPPSTRPRDYRPRPAQQPDQSEEERLQKFMEALGVPTVPEPPRKIVRPQQTAPRPAAPYIRREMPKPEVFVPQVNIPPPVSAKPEPEELRWEQVPPPVVAQKVSPPPVVVASPVVSVSTAGISPLAGSAPLKPVDLQFLLKSPASLRAAILMKEILGPPRSLQPFTGQGALL